MNNLKLYVMALYAVKPDPEFMDITEPGHGRVGYRVESREDMNLTAHSFLDSHMDVAASLEQAKEYGLERALEKWPKAEGYVAHTVAITEVRKADVEWFLDLLPSGTPEAGQDSDSEVSELLM